MWDASSSCLQFFTEKYLMTLTSPTSWALHHNPGFTIMASSRNGLSGPSQKASHPATHCLTYATLWSSWEIHHVRYSFCLFLVSKSSPTETSCQVWLPAWDGTWNSCATIEATSGAIGKAFLDNCFLGASSLSGSFSRIQSLIRWSLAFRAPFLLF